MARFQKKSKQNKNKNMHIHENRLVFLDRPSNSPKQEAAKKMMKETWKGAPGKGINLNLSAESAQALARKEAEKLTKDDGKKLADVLADTKSKEVNPADVARKNGYDSVGEYEKGVAIAVKGDSSFLVDKVGNKISKEYFEIEAFHNGIAIAHDLNGENEHQIIFINNSGKEINSKIYWDAHAFSEGKAGVKEKGNKWTFIDTKGKDLNIGQYDEVYDFNGGIAGVRNGARWKFIKEDGSKLNDKTYDAVEDFDVDEGIAMGKRGGKWHMINKFGQELPNTTPSQLKENEKVKVRLD